MQITIPEWLISGFQAFLGIITAIWTGYQHRQHKQAKEEIEKIKNKVS